MVTDKQGPLYFTGFRLKENTNLLKINMVKIIEIIVKYLKYI